MTQAPSRDHYVPQFTLRRFRPENNGKLFYADTTEGTLSRRGVKRVFATRDGELLLKEPLSIRKEGRYAVVDKEPVFTLVARDDLKRLDNLWARAIRNLVEYFVKQKPDRSRSSTIIPVRPVPDEQKQWCELAKQYCLQQRFRSPSVADEVWSILRDQEEQSLRWFILDTLGEDLEPRNDVRDLWQKQSRHQISSGVLLHELGFFERTDADLILSMYYISSNTSRFILGDKGGVCIDDDLGGWLFPVDPRIAFALTSRTEFLKQSGFPLDFIGHVAKVTLLPQENLTVASINSETWRQSQAVVARRRDDIEQVSGPLRAVIR